MAEKFRPALVHHPARANYVSSIMDLTVASVFGGLANAFLSGMGLLIFMPCMLSDAAGSFVAIRYLKRGGRGAPRKPQAFALGALSGLLGSVFLGFAIALVFLIVPGGLLSMVSSLELLERSISGVNQNFSFLVVFLGITLVLFKMLVSGIVAVGLSTIE